MRLGKFLAMTRGETYQHTVQKGKALLKKKKESKINETNRDLEERL